MNRVFIEEVIVDRIPQRPYEFMFTGAPFLTEQGNDEIEVDKDNSMEDKTMKVNVFRDSTSQCGEKILIGEFKDVYHPVVFLKSLLDEEEERASQGGFVVEFDFSTEVNENA